MKIEIDFFIGSRNEELGGGRGREGVVSEVLFPSPDVAGDVWEVEQEDIGVTPRSLSSQLCGDRHPARTPRPTRSEVCLHSQQEELDET